MSAVVDSVIPLDRGARLYGQKIQKAWQKSVEGILEAGDLLLQAKADLRHGEFERMVRESCPFGKTTAHRLMRIASHPVLSNVAHAQHLPASWMMLAELAKFEPRELSHALRNYWIKPETKREEVGEGEGGAGAGVSAGRAGAVSHASRVRGAHDRVRVHGRGCPAGPHSGAGRPTEEDAVTHPLRQIRHERLMSITDLAKRARVHPMTIERVELQIHSPSMSTRRKVLRVLGIELARHREMFGPLPRREAS